MDLGGRACFEALSLFCGAPNMGAVLEVQVLP